MRPPPDIRASAAAAPVLGLVPGRQIMVKKLRPFTVSIDGSDQVVPRKLADAVGVGCSWGELLVGEQRLLSCRASA